MGRAGVCVAGDHKEYLEFINTCIVVPTLVISTYTCACTFNNFIVYQHVCMHIDNNGGLQA